MKRRVTEMSGLFAVCIAVLSFDKQQFRRSTVKDVNQTAVQANQRCAFESVIIIGMIFISSLAPVCAQRMLTGVWSTTVLRSVP